MDMSRKFLISAIVGAACVVAAPAWAQTSGTIAKAVGGYNFDEAAKANPDTPNFHSKDGKLTFAIVTHTAGNGFFDPTYVGAKAAADLLGVNLIMLGSEAPVDDIPRELEILNQIIQDPTIDGLIMTTPQSGAYDHIVKKAWELGIPVDANNIVSSIVSLIESRGDVVGIMGANGFVTPAIADAVGQLKIGDKVCSYGFDLGPKQLEAIRNGNLDGALGQQPFLQGFWPVM